MSTPVMGKGGTDTKGKTLRGNIRQSKEGKDKIRRNKDKDSGKAYEGKNGGGGKESGKLDRWPITGSKQ